MTTAPEHLLAQPAIERGPWQRTTESEEAPPSAMTTMKAITAARYGSPDVLQLREVDIPAIAPDQVLLRVRATSLNPVDYHLLHGALFIRLTNGFRRPQQLVPGSDVAGIVEAVGESVTDLRPGDEVFGACPGALAEYAAGGKNLIPKPATISFEQAASVAIAGCTALQSLRDVGKLQPGQSVLINGASGGVGTFAVQIARALGGHVTGVCSARNLDLVRSLGAEHVIYYTSEDFARSGRRYDLVVDFVGNRSLADLRRALTPDGAIVLSGGGHQNGHGKNYMKPITLMAQASLRSRFRHEKLGTFIARIKRDDLLTLKELMEAGALTPVVDRTYPLTEISDAMRYLASGHAPAKVVITM